MWLCCVMCNIIASTWIRIQFYTVHLFFLKALRAKLHKNEFDCDKFQFSKGAPHQETEVMCPKSMQIMYPSGLTWPVPDRFNGVVVQVGDANQRG
jgi:hypothetical protein